jgi:bifunctional non-homologous end joining protein LigD
MSFAANMPRCSSAWRLTPADAAAKPTGADCCRRPEVQHIPTNRSSERRMLSTFPEWIEPMAATLTQERFTGAEWTFERKLDGIRMLAFRRGRDTRLFSRTKHVQDLPAVAAAISRLPVRDAILDGELTWESGVAYHLFDVVWLDGRDVTRLPLTERRALLEALPIRPPLYRVPVLHDAEPWERARVEGWEGVIAKRLDSPYIQGRSKHWLKMKCELVQDFVVGGFTDPMGTRIGLGALLVGYFDGSDFVFAGKVGTGFDTTMLIDLRARLDRLGIPAAPFTKATGLPRVRAHWVTPDIVVQVAFIEWTVHGKLRHSRLLGVRTDLRARDVVRTA